MARGRVRNTPRGLFWKAFTENTKAVILINGLDECQNAHKTDSTLWDARTIVQFFGTLLEIASRQGDSLDLCVTGQSNLTLRLPQAWEAVVDRCNMLDISTYLSTQLTIINEYDRQHILDLSQDIVRRSSGLFLWAKLIVDMLLWSELGLSSETAHFTPPGLENDLS